MSDDLEHDPGIRLSVAAALGRQYAQDLQSFIPFLAETLQKAFPEAVEIHRRGMFKKETIGVSLTLGADRFGFLRSTVGGVTATKTHIVRGIALKTEELPIHEALEALAFALDEQVKSNAKAQSALAGLLGL
jgi:hypothetical protein